MAWRTSGRDACVGAERRLPVPEPCTRNAQAVGSKIRRTPIAAAVADIQMIISKLIPELERFPTNKARRRALSVAIGVLGTHWLYGVAVAGIVAASVVTQFSLPRLGIPMAWRGMVRWLVVAATVIAFWVLLLSFKKTIRRTLWRALADRGIPCCTSCGYDLRLLPTQPEDGTTVCPECGCAWELGERPSAHGSGQPEEP